MMSAEDKKKDAAIRKRIAREHAEERAAICRVVAVERAYDDTAMRSGSAEERRIVEARAFMVNWWKCGLSAFGNIDEFWAGVREVAQERELPFVELVLGWAAHLSHEFFPVTRAELIEWVDWCQRHAPARISSETVALISTAQTTRPAKGSDDECDSGSRPNGAGQAV